MRLALVNGRRVPLSSAQKYLWNPLSSDSSLLFSSQTWQDVRRHKYCSRFKHILEEISKGEPSQASNTVNTRPRGTTGKDTGTKEGLRSDSKGKKSTKFLLLLQWQSHRLHHHNHISHWVLHHPPTTKFLSLFWMNWRCSNRSPFLLWIRCLRT